MTDRDGNREIYVMNTDGSEPVYFTNDPAQDTDPAWSPDGTRTAFTTTRDGPGAEIYVMNPDGSDPVNLTETAGTIEREPAWSPDPRRSPTPTPDTGNTKCSG